MIGFVQGDGYGNTMFNGVLQQNDDGRPTEISSHLYEKFKAGDTRINETTVVRDAAARDALMQLPGGPEYVKRIYDQYFDYRNNSQLDPEYVYTPIDAEWYEAQGWEWTPSTNASGPNTGLGFGHESGGNGSAQQPTGSQPTGSKPTDSKPAGSPPEDEVKGSQPSPQPQTPRDSSVRSSTPFLDAYLRAREASQKEGPVSGMMKEYM